MSSKSLWSIDRQKNIGTEELFSSVSSFYLNKCKWRGCNKVRMLVLSCLRGSQKLWEELEERINNGDVSLVKMINCQKRKRKIAMLWWRLVLIKKTGWMHVGSDCTYGSSVVARGSPSFAEVFNWFRVFGHKCNNNNFLISDRWARHFLYRKCWFMATTLSAKEPQSQWFA